MSEELNPFSYEPIAISTESTVITEFLPEAHDVREQV
jgi:hypothetical protein